MKRRKFLGSVAGVAAVAAATSIPAPALSKGLVEWRMATAWPKGLPGLWTGAERIANRISTMSEGRLKIKLFASGEIVPGLQVFDAVSQGTVEMGHDASFYHLGKSRATAFFAAVPFGLTAVEHAAWIQHGGGQALWDDLYRPFNLRPFMGGSTGTQMFGWFRKPITSVDDFDGLKMRMPGLGGAVAGKLGTAVVLTSGGEIFPALQSGAIDAAEFIGPYNDLPLGLHKVAKYYYAPGYQDSGTSMETIVNTDAYDALSDDLKLIIKASTDAEVATMWSEYQYGSSKALEVLKRDHGVKVGRVPKEVMLALGKAAAEVYEEEWESGTEDFRKIMKAYKEARKSMVEYSFLAEQSYMNARSLVNDFLNKV